MRIQWFVPALLLILAASPALGLTVSDVVEMTEAGLGDDVIINQIRATHSRFDLTVDDIVALHNVGVSDAVLSFMISTAFDTDTTTDYAYGDDYGTTYTVLREEPEPEVHTYVHLGLGYYHYPWSYVWWDYWWPDWDYYWYAGTYCRPYWCWRYRPWYYDTYCWSYHRCGPSYGWRVWDDCDRYCDVRHGRDWDRVRWKSSTPSPQVTLASSRARTKAIRDADQGRTYSPLARLEPQRAKSPKYRSAVVAGGVNQYGQASKSRSTAALVHSNKRRAVSTGQSVGTIGNVTRSKVTSGSGATISRSKRLKIGDSSTSSIRSTKPSSGSSRSPATVQGSKQKSSRSSAATSRSSVRSKSGSSQPSPARSSSGSSSKSTSNRSSGSKKKK